MKRCVLLLTIAGLAGCYNYGHNKQGRLFWHGPDPQADLAEAREDRDARDRREAIVRLVRCQVAGPEANRHRSACRRVLREAASLRHEQNAVIRSIAAASLRQLGAPEDVPLLVRCLKGDPGQNLDPEASPDVRRELVNTLGLLGSPNEVPVLADVLRKDPDVETRVEAARALARLGSQTAVEGLLQGLADPDESVAFACHQGLVRTTGQNLPPSAVEWQQWWQGRKEPPLSQPGQPGTRAPSRGP